MRIILLLVISLFISCKNESKIQPESKVQKTEKITYDSIPANHFQLPLEEKLTDSIIKLPYELKENEISIVIGINYGWLTFDEQNHFIYSADSIVRHFKEKIPKSYLKKNKEKYSLEEIVVKPDLKNKLLTTLHSDETTSFLDYKQENFSFKSNRRMPCHATDNNSYSIYFIQNNKIKSYWYYNPKYVLEKCKDENVNKKMLEHFIKILESYNTKL